MDGLTESNRNAFKEEAYELLNGYIFIGHSESMNGMNVPFVAVAPAIYRKASK